MYVYIIHPVWVVMNFHFRSCCSNQFLFINFICVIWCVCYHVRCTWVLFAIEVCFGWQSGCFVTSLLNITNYVWQDLSHERIPVIFFPVTTICVTIPLSIWHHLSCCYCILRPISARTCWAMGVACGSDMCHQRRCPHAITLAHIRTVWYHYQIVSHFVSKRTPKRHLIGILLTWIDFNPSMNN